MKRLLLTLLLAVPVASQMGVKAQDVDNPCHNWMGRISDDAYFMQLSIPGTHDAGTGDGFTWGDLGDMFGKTQDLTLAQQWAAGIRAFDLRPAVGSTDDCDDLIIHHGILATNTRFEDALLLLCDSLRANPTETAVVMMRFEDDNGGARTTWNSLMNELLSRPEISERLIDFKPKLTLGEMRGKLLLASRDAYDSKPKGAFITGWTHDAEFAKQKSANIKGRTLSCTLYVQDFYDLTASGALDKKVNAITTMLDATTTFHTRKYLSSIWVVNHCSGYTQSASVDGNRECAATTNKAVADYLSDETHYGPTGIVMMDFAGVDRSGSHDVMGQTLLQTIVDLNFRYQPMTTAISLPEANGGQQDGVGPEVSSTAYDLSGRPVSTAGPSKGIAVRKGRKELKR